MAKTKDIQRRIKSIGSIKKITKAMEMVAAAKMRRAIDSVLRTRSYANLSWETVGYLATWYRHNGQDNHPLLSERATVKRTAVVLLAANRGLCGGFNSSLLAKVKVWLKTAEGEVDFIVVGKRGLAIVRAGQKIAAEFAKPDLVTGLADIVPVAKLLMADFIAGRYDKIMLAYTDFVSVSRQMPRVQQLLPIDLTHAELGVSVEGAAVSQEFLAAQRRRHLAEAAELLFEPTPAAVLDKLVPQLLRVQLYQALLATTAAEHSARMAAMHQATQAAGDMVADFTLAFNKARQAGITAEIAEISAGANALAI